LNQIQQDEDKVRIMTKPYHLYIVEDDSSLRSMLSEYLEKQGIAVTTMTTAEDLLKRVNRLRPDLIILDVSLPGMNGLQACQKLRAQGDAVPIIILTARSEEVDRVLGLEMGADDFLGKPFSARELLARVHAVLRRSAVTPGTPVLGSQPVKIADMTFDLSARCLSTPNGVKILSTVEYAVLAELVKNPGIAIARERLLAVSHSRSDDYLARAIDVTVMRLRKLIEPDPQQPRYIQTVRSHGYMFIPDSTQLQSEQIK
jgi:two-component system, OmpR family, phosphate regulon response regulator OmpR